MRDLVREMEVELVWVDTELVWIPLVPAVTGFLLSGAEGTSG